MLREGLGGVFEETRFKTLIFYFIYLLSYLSVPFGTLLRLLSESLYSKTLRLFYDLFSKFYDNFTLSLPGYSAVLRLIAELANSSRRDPVLDVACGTGLVSLLLAQRAREVVGLDLSPGQLK
ncbi:MAG: hypothetical protein DRK00_10930 [Thermoprotei archaeon]|nr:MAG: hypothetical protein DRK00_10930 [Thermoprotei archaeon]